MPRNISGIYTLPEAAFVAGTTILSAAVNSDLSDIATALTQSLATTGVSSMTGPFKAATGSVSAPSITFGSATGTGLYLSGTNEFSWTAAGILQATFGASGNVTWVGAHTFQSTTTFTGVATFTAVPVFSSGLSATSIITGTEPALTIRNSDNDASEHELVRYALGSGAGNTASRRIIGTGANDVSEIRDYIASTEILRQTASLVSPKKNISLDAGIIVIATAGYIDSAEIATPSSPAADRGRAYFKDFGGVTLFVALDSAGTETSLVYPARAYAEITTSVSVTSNIPGDGTIPQNTEGVELLTATITLKKSTSRVRVQADIAQVAISGSELPVMTAFIDSSSNALNVHHMNLESTVSPVAMSMLFEHAPGSVGPHTYSIRGGSNGGASVIFNSGTSLFGSIGRATLILQEIFVSA